MSDPQIIILAEPNPLISMPLRTEFSNAGFTVLLAASGPEAEDWASQITADLVVLDVALPGVTSYDACARIRRLSGYEETPIVLTADRLRPRIKAAAAAARVTEVLEKPFSFRDLIVAVAPHLPVDSALRMLCGRTGMAEVPQMIWKAPPSWNPPVVANGSVSSRMLPILPGRGRPVASARKP
jgi:DNA-binding response OmpR family regulator